MLYDRFRRAAFTMLCLLPVVAEAVHVGGTELSFSDYIVYVDESGDHGLQTIDRNYPVFVLAFCIFHKRYYSDTVVPALKHFKFRHFGHDIVILHENEIRKEKGNFNIFRNRHERVVFLDELSGIVEASNFILISCVIEKVRLLKHSSAPDNPYHLALGLGLELIHGFLEEKGEQNKLTHLVFERRGKKEDNELELEFRRICAGANRLDGKLPFEIIFADKQANSAGLQLADLVARPVGLHVLRPEQPNRAFDLLESKFYCEGGRKNVGDGYEELGLKRFPKSEKPR